MSIWAIRTRLMNFLQNAERCHGITRRYCGVATPILPWSAHRRAHTHTHTQRPYFSADPIGAELRTNACYGACRVSRQMRSSCCDLWTSERKPDPAMTTPRPDANENMQLPRKVPEIAFFMAFAIGMLHSFAVCCYSGPDRWSC